LDLREIKAKNKCCVYARKNVCIYTFSKVLFVEVFVKFEIFV
jgi:hypothetical protein